jgi:hypothetical protein
MRKCAYCDKEELCGIGESSTPVCGEHFDQYLARKLAPLKQVIANLRSEKYERQT